MIKVFYRCIRQPKYEIPDMAFTIGKEYPLDILDGCIPVIISDGSYPWSENILSSPSGFSGCFQRIEREVFEREGIEWFKHTPGDPMPDTGSQKIIALLKNGKLAACGNAHDAIVFPWHSTLSDDSMIIGWRYSDQEIKPEGKSSLDISTEKKPDFQFQIDPSENLNCRCFIFGAPPLAKPNWQFKLPDLSAVKGEHFETEPCAVRDIISTMSEPESTGERQYREKVEAQDKADQEAEQAKADELKEVSNVLGNFPDSDFSGQIGGFRRV